MPIVDSKELPEEHAFDARIHFCIEAGSPLHQ